MWVFFATLIMRILFYAGYQKNKFDGDTNEGLAGTEIAIINIAEEMVKFGYKVVVSGEVKDSGLINGVEWISTHELHEKYFDQFDYIISASYIHFLKEFERYSAKKVFWAHNTHHHPWWNHEVLEDANLLTQQVDHTICLTNWHKNHWAHTYNIPLNKISVIGNAIDPSTFSGTPEKVKGKFIYSSAPERGLLELLKNWPKIKTIMPHATLDIYSPGYSIANHTDYSFNKFKEVTCHGSVDQKTLHNAMLRAEYWCYITDYEETYCITALEMQYAKVLPIVTKVAALKETVNSGVILERNETNWNQAIQILGTLSSGLKDKSINDAYKWSKQQTWNVRSYDWKNILESI